MSIGGSPTGRSLGVLKCTSKSELGEKWNVTFTGEHGSAGFMLSAEDAEYFKIDEHYHLTATNH